MDASNARTEHAAGGATRGEGQPRRPLQVSVDDSIGAREEGAGADAAAAAPGSRRVAVIVCHGMGQQVPFETLDGIASAIVAIRDEVAGPGGTPSIEAEQVATEEGVFLPRAQVLLPGADGRTVTAHFYEAYWAPLTEGKVTLRDTLLFLLGAGWRGTRFAFGDGMFDRWMFGRRQEFEIPARQIAALLLAWCVTLLVAASCVVFPAIVVAAGARGIGLRWPPVPTIALLLGAGAWLLAGLLLLGVGGWLASRLFGNSHHRTRSWYPDREAREPAPGPAQWGALAGTLVLIVAALLAASWGAWRTHAWLMAGAPDAASAYGAYWAAGARTRYAVAATLAAAVALVLLWLRWFLVEFPGDVAAYVSSYKVSKFQELRRQIQQTGRVVARYVYGTGYPRAGAPPPGTAYDEVMLVGHSLGSVLAYDTLGDAINRDQHVHGWFPDSGRACYDVAARTSLLLTFGSPLDKTAFIFRTQKVRTEFDVREALATTMQPLIADYAHRPDRWINIWSRWDWVSGPLEYYDAPAPDDARGAPHAGKRVVNVEASTSRLPGGAHTGYWGGPVVRAVLYAALTRTSPQVKREAVASDDDLQRLARALGALGDPSGTGAEGAAAGS